MLWRSHMVPTLLVTTLLVLVASPAQADAEFEACQSTYDGGRFQEAYICYKKGYEKNPNFMWAANLGNVEVKLGKYKDAIPHLEYALEHVDPASPNVELTRQRLRAKIAEATAQVAVVTVSLTPANTNGASIAINGNVVGVTPLTEPIILDAGTYKLTATHPQFADLTYEVVAQPNTTPTLNLQMKPRASSSGGSGVSGAMIGVAVAGGVLALGALGAGIGLHVAAGGKASDREDIAADLGDTTICSDPNSTDPRCPQLQELADDENTFTTAGTAMLIVGGVLAAGTIVAVILWPKGSSNQGSLWIAPGPTSLHVGGTF